MPCRKPKYLVEPDQTHHHKYKTEDAISAQYFTVRQGKESSVSSNPAMHTAIVQSSKNFASFRTLAPFKINVSLLPRCRYQIGQISREPQAANETHDKWLFRIETLAAARRPCGQRGALFRTIAE